ncbi:hypothetical protein QDA04_gp53 [Microbacterium phage Megan]|uniref:Uncharacterized protein n=1 Tax=Microbacterium phage Megan TaxID=2656551 RepID=A0A649VM01_9CAUD|nr:hypothetical protein QDA04_gp53 [Microbacterium phage Megan]QGJ92723.1 hypothetical protein PBI_MEGAN_53 [Microbacterium phage Megan]
MGAGLALDAIAAARHAGLGAVPTLLLVRFALAAVDADAEPWARLSWEERCEAICRDDDGTRGTKEAVSRATAECVRAGLLVHLDGGHRGQVSRYGVRVKGTRSARTNDAGKVHAERQKGTRSTGPKVHAQRVPKEEQGGAKEARARARPAACSKHPDGNSSRPCRECQAVREWNDAQPTVSAMHTVQPGVPCPEGRHKRLPDGTCLWCDDRPVTRAPDHDMLDTNPH